MKKIIVVGIAIFAMSTSFAYAKGAKKSKAPAATSQSMIWVSAADKMAYKKNKHDSGIK